MQPPSKEEMRKGIFKCFKSPVRAGKDLLYYDCKTSARVHAAHAYRGFLRHDGRLRRDLSPLERMVIRMREAATGEPYNHEWWAEWVSSPEWFKKLHETLLESWLYYPAAGENIEARDLGQRIGYELEYKRRRFARAIEDADFIKRWQLALFGPPEPIELPEAWKNEKVVHDYLIDGYKDWKEYARDGLGKVEALRKRISGLALKLREDYGLFMEGMGLGNQRAGAVNLDQDLVGIDEREAVLTILESDYELIAQMRNRREVTDHIISRLPEQRREFLKNEAQYASFTERLRNTYYSKIQLRPAAKGRPSKLEKFTPRRSRLLIYTPDLPSGRENES